MFTTSKFLTALVIGIIIVLSQLYISLSNLRNPHQIIIGEELYLLTKDVNIIPIHSHNDEWRENPFLDAYKIGAKSIEADVWAFTNSHDKLYIGHNKNYLSSSLNLQHYYLDPIYSILSVANNGSQTNNGVYYDDPGQSLFLYIDVKASSGDTTLKYLTKALTKFIENDWLTYYDDSAKMLQWRPLTIIITGNYPLEYITKLDNRYYFIDSPLLEISNDDFIELYKPGQISLTTSGSMKKLINGKISIKDGFTDDQLSNLQMVINKCQDLGLITRIWDTPNWPLRTRNKIWLQLLDSNVDLLNVDDLQSAVKYF